MACAITSPAPRCSDTLSLLHPRNLPGVRDAATLFTTERKAACCDGAAPLWLINSPSALLGALQFEGVTCGVSAGSSSAGHFDFLGAFASGQVLPTGWCREEVMHGAALGVERAWSMRAGGANSRQLRLFILPPAQRAKRDRRSTFPVQGIEPITEQLSVCLLHP